MTDDRQLDTAMVQAFVDGDQRAFDDLMRRHEDRVFAICLRVMGDRELALDATQETFVTLYRKAHLYKEEAAFSTWLYRVAVNTCYDQHRRRARQRTEMIPEGMEPADPTAGDAFDRSSFDPSWKRRWHRSPSIFGPQSSSPILKACLSRRSQTCSTSR